MARLAKARRDGVEAALFLGLTFVLTLPLLLISASLRVELMPGLPLAGLAAVCPAAAAFGITLASGGRLRSLLGAAADRPGPAGGAACWLVAVFAAPGVALLSFLVLRAEGSGIPAPRFETLQVLGLALIFLLAGTLEEIGWSAFLLRRLQHQQRPLVAGLVVGAAWAVWHYPALIEVGRSLGWIAWWTLGTLAMRLVMAWIFNGTGGGLAGVTLFHAMSNLSWQLFPVSGSWFDPRVHGILMAVLALVIAPALLRLQGSRNGGTGGPPRPVGRQ